MRESVYVDITFLYIIQNIVQKLISYQEERAVIQQGKKDSSLQSSVKLAVKHVLYVYTFLI